MTRIAWRLSLTSVLAFFVGFAMWATLAAGAHGASDWGGEWSADTKFYIGNSGGLGQSNLYSVTVFGAAQWNAASGSWMDISWGGYTSSGPWYSGCSVPSAAIYVSGGVPAHFYATEYSCGGITRSSIVLNTARSWYFGSGTPLMSQADGRSTASHELGHGLGYTGHWEDKDGDVECSTDIRETMCSSWGLGTIYMRDLGAHDLHTFANEY